MDIDKFVGCMLGLAIGDAVGEAKQHNESMSIQEIIGKRLLYTDDTALALALLNTIIKDDNLSYESVGEGFLEAINSEPSRGYGGEQLIYYTAEQNHISYIEARDRVNKAFRNGEGSCGDGAAMRIAPLALYYRDDPRINAMIGISCTIDHNSEVALDSCNIVCKVIGDTIGDLITNENDYINTLISTVKTPEMSESLSIVGDSLKSKVSLPIVDTKLGNTNRSHTKANSVVGYALFCYLRNRNDFSACLEDCCNSNGDADTIAAIGSSFSGADCGYSKIEPKYYNSLENANTLISRTRDLHNKMLERRLRRERRESL